MGAVLSCLIPGPEVTWAVEQWPNEGAGEGVCLGKAWAQVNPLLVAGDPWGKEREGSVSRVSETPGVKASENQENKVHG
jgi:hypothetical protein